jgi:glycine cleavage system H protein
VSELFSPVAGEVVEVNRSLADRPETVNKDPHDAWMIAIKLTGPEDQTELLDAGQYTQLTQ